MLLGDILNGKEKSHLVVIHGKHFFSFQDKKLQKIMITLSVVFINAFKPATFTLLDIAAQAFHVSLTYLADSISQSGRPLLYCFVKSLLKR